MVNNVVHQKKTRVLEQRLSSKSECCIFQILYPSNKHAVVYDVYSGSNSRNIIRSIAMLWYRQVQLEKLRV